MAAFKVYVFDGPKGQFVQKYISTDVLVCVKYSTSFYVAVVKYDLTTKLSHVQNIPF